MAGSASEPGGAGSALDGADTLVRRVLREQVGEPIALYRFGSSVDGPLLADSDLDYALLARVPLDPVERFEIQEHLAGLLRRSVDLVDLRRASTVMRMQVISRGVVVAVSDAVEKERFELFVYASYARLNEERRDILAEIARRGRVYGR
jgi:hypothetical protein